MNTRNRFLFFAGFGLQTPRCRRRSSWGPAVAALVASGFLTLPAPEIWAQAVEESRAQITATAGVTPPEREAVVAHDSANSNGWQWRWSADLGRRDVGQTFTAPRDFELAQIALGVRSGSAPSVSRAPFVLTLARYADAQALAPAEKLAEWVGVLPDNENGRAYGPERWLTLNVPAVKLMQNQVYGFALRFQGPGQAGNGVVFAVPTEGYPQGTAFFSEDGVTMKRALDLSFQIIAKDSPLRAAGAPRVLEVDRTGNGPFKTLAAAARVARPGDTIRVKPGTGPYRETLFIPASGTAQAPIVFDGGGNLVTGFEPLTGFETGAEGARLKLPRPWPLVLSYKGERLVQNSTTGQLTRFATLNEARDTLTLLPGTSTEGWEVATRAMVVQVLDASYHTYRNVKASGSTNDGFNLHGAGKGLLFENVEGFHNLDEGFSAHDQIECAVKNAKFWGNDNGVGNVARSVATFENVDIYDNLGFGFWLNDCTGVATNVRSWNNGAAQVLFRSAKVTVNNVTAFTPNFTSRPWQSYMESKTATLAPPAVADAASTVSAPVTVSPMAAPTP